MSTDHRVKLIGLDFGSTTSSIMLLEVTVERHSVTGRFTFSAPEVLLKPEPVFTPFKGNTIDADALVAQLDGWLAQVGWQSTSASLFSGSALVTGNAAQSNNVELIKRLVVDRIGPSLIANADDPKLESWLAFMGSCATLSRQHATRQVLNLDIGGGTTNPAMGLNGEVRDCACYFIGARHLIFRPNSFVLAGYSETGKILLRYLGIEALIGQRLTTEAVQQCIELLLCGLEAIVSGETEFFEISSTHRALVQSPSSFSFCEDTHNAPIVTFSGGVGELIYRFLNSGVWPRETLFGDLGVGLAKAIVASPLLSASLDFRPEHMGRATVLGLALHSAEVSGSSLFISNTAQLPLADLPILSRLTSCADISSWQRSFNLAKNTQRGACFVIQHNGPAEYTKIRSLANNISQALLLSEYPSDQPLVLLVDLDIGKTLGQYITDWGNKPRSLFVIDEIPMREARFVQVGEYHQGIVPVSFFSMH